MLSRRTCNAFIFIVTNSQSLVPHARNSLGDGPGSTTVCMLLLPVNVNVLEAGSGGGQKVHLGSNKPLITLALANRPGYRRAISRDRYPPNENPPIAHRLLSSGIPYRRVTISTTSSATNAK
jgi:hypothetical protein